MQKKETRNQTEGWVNILRPTPAEPAQDEPCPAPLSAEAEKAMCEDPYGPKVRPLAYVLHVPRLTETARQHGYALAVHGSLQRDLDLIACPWSEAASEPEVLILALCQRVGGFMLPTERATEKPHGRRTWIIHLGAGLYIDLSIMPQRDHKLESELEALRAGFNAEGESARESCCSQFKAAQQARIEELEYARAGTLETILGDIIQHDEKHPEHGAGCSCHDLHAGRLRALISDYLDGKPTRDKSLSNLLRVLHYVIQNP